MTAHTHVATCENCWKAFEAGYGEAEKAYLATIESRDAELATLAVEATKLREALEDAREALNWRDNEIRLGIRDPLGEAEIRALGERFGFGVLMSTASRLWYEKAGPGAFAVGHCIAIVKQADQRAAAALGTTEVGR